MSSHIQLTSDSGDFTVSFNAQDVSSLSLFEGGIGGIIHLRTQQPSISWPHSSIKTVANKLEAAGHTFHPVNLTRAGCDRRLLSLQAINCAILETQRGFSSEISLYIDGYKEPLAGTMFENEWRALEQAIADTSRPLFSFNGDTMTRHAGFSVRNESTKKIHIFADAITSLACPPDSRNQQLIVSLQNGSELVLEVDDTPKDRRFYVAEELAEANGKLIAIRSENSCAYIDPRKKDYLLVASTDKQSNPAICILYSGKNPRESDRSLVVSFNDKAAHGAAWNALVKQQNQALKKQGRKPL